jgi:hypothetical protein
MARTSSFGNKFVLAAMLENPEKISRYIALQLVAKGYLKIEKVKENPGRGRASHVYAQTGKAKGYIALSRNWKKNKVSSDKVEVSSEPLMITYQPSDFAA